MVDGVNFNPFTGKALTAEEIQKLDANRDGVVSSEEFTANISWISQGQDVEGEVQIDEGTQNPSEPEQTEPAPELDTRGQGIYNAAINNGAQSTANNQQELQEYLTKVESQYIEKKLGEADITDSTESSQIVTYLRNQKTEFLNEYLQKNPQGPYDMEAVSAAYIQKMDAAFVQRQEGVDAFNDSLADKKASAGNFDALYETANSAGSYMDPDEFQNLKDKAIDYILGKMMKGEVDVEFFYAVDNKYSSNGYYIQAQNAIKSMQSASDPEKMQEYLAKAEEAIGKLIGGQNVDGSSKLTDAINSTHDKAVKAEYTEVLTELIDKMAEAYSNETETRSTGIFGNHTRTVLANSEDDVANYTARMKNVMNEFLEQYDGDRENLEAEFKKYLNEVNAQLEDIQGDIANNAQTRGSSDTTSDAYDSLHYQVDNVGTYVSDAEKEGIIEAATDLFITSMSEGTETSALASIYPNYTTDPDYLEAKSLLDGIETSATPQEDYEKIKELLSGMLENRGVDNIISGVKTEESKNINLQPGSLTQGIWGYASKDTYGGDNVIAPSFKIDENGTLTWTNSKDKGDIEKALSQLQDRIKAQLQQQLGSLYNEADIEQYFNDAIIAELLNLDNANNHITVDNFINGILKEFNEIATKGLKGGASNDGTLDRTQVLKDSGAVDDYASGELRGSTKWRSGDAKSSVKSKAREKLELLRSSLMAQAQAILGDKYVESDIKTMIDQSITSTVDSYGYWDTKSGPRERYAFNANQMYDNFFNTFEQKLQAYKASK